MTATRPAPIPAISRLPDDPLLLVDVAEAAAPVAVPVAVSVAEPVCAPAVVAVLEWAEERAWLSVGSAGFPLTNQPEAVDVGQAGGVMLGVYSELGVPVGVKVDH